jgi:hypothetical protein
MDDEGNMRATDAEIATPTGIPTRRISDLRQVHPPRARNAISLPLASILGELTSTTAHSLLVIFCSRTEGAAGAILRPVWRRR